MYQNYTKNLFKNNYVFSICINNLLFKYNWENNQDKSLLKSGFIQATKVIQFTHEKKNQSQGQVAQGVKDREISHKMIFLTKILLDHDMYNGQYLHVEINL